MATARATKATTARTATRPTRPTTEAERRERAVELARDASYLGVPRLVCVTKHEIVFSAPSRSQPHGDDGRLPAHEVRYDREVDTFSCECAGAKGHGYCAHIGAAWHSIQMIEREERALSETKPTYGTSTSTSTSQLHSDEDQVRVALVGTLEDALAKIAASEEPVIESREELHAAAYDLGWSFARVVWPYEGSPARVRVAAGLFCNLLLEFIPSGAIPTTVMLFQHTVKIAFTNGFNDLFGERAEAAAAAEAAAEGETTK